MDTNITFLFNKPFEFLYSLFAIGTEDNFYKMIVDYNLEPNEDIREFINTNNNNLSQYLQKELKYFFDLSGLGYVLYKVILKNENIKEVSELIAFVENLSKNDLTLLMVRSFFKKSLTLKELSELTLDKKGKHEIIDLLEKTSFQHEDRKKKIIDSLENPEEIKQRLLLLLRQYYEKSFKRIETKLEMSLSTEKAKYESTYNTDPKSFILKYLNINNSTEYSNISVHISFFKYVGIQHYSLEEVNSSDWFILGIYTDVLFDSEKNDENLAVFFKALSDANRIKIIKLLKDRPWFGLELAEKLNLTPATISYHMGFLQQAGIVTYEKSEKRSYFSLKNERVTKILQDFLKDL